MRFQKPHKERCRLDFKEKACSSQNPPSSQGKSPCVTPSAVDISHLVSSKQNKGKRALESLGHRSIELETKLSDHSSSSGVPTCHFCSTEGHIPPYCFLLRSRIPKKTVTLSCIGTLDNG